MVFGHIIGSQKWEDNRPGWRVSHQSGAIGGGKNIGECYVLPDTSHSALVTLHSSQHPFTVRTTQQRWLASIFVDPDYRGIGVGTALLRAILVSADQSGVQTVNLRVERDNDKAQRLYQRVGFAVDDSHLVMACGRTPSGSPVGAK